MTKGVIAYSSKKIFFDIFSTLNWMLTDKFTDRSIKEINKQKSNSKDYKEISEERMHQINKKHFIKNRNEELCLCLWLTAKY